MMYTCDGDVGTQMVYDSADCSGTGTSITLDGIFENIVCGGEACDYGVYREYTKDDNGDCSDMYYEEQAVFTDRCLGIFTSSLIFTCTASSGTETNYSAVDCTGESTFKSTDDADACASLIMCSTDTDTDTDTDPDTDTDTDTDPDTDTDTDPDTSDPDTDTDTDEVATACKAAYVGDVPTYPLDVCYNSVVSSTSSMSYMLSCDDNDVVNQMVYNTADCSGDATTTATTYDGSMCDESACSYATYTVETGEAGSCDGTDYVTTDYVVDVCYSVGSGSAMLMCDSDGISA